MAFPGSIFGAVLCGLAWKKTENLPLTLAGEVFGTSVLGGLCAYPVAVLLMGQAAGEVAFYAYIIPFLISTGAGSILSGILIYALKKKWSFAYDTKQVGAVVQVILSFTRSVLFGADFSEREEGE